MREYGIGHIAGLRLSVKPSALVALPVLWGVAAVGAARQIHLPLHAASVPALIAVLGHILSGIWHHLGHAFAARATGYPMIGIRVSGLFATSIYPKDEPQLPAELHIRRALGGPLASGLLTLIMWALVRLARPTHATTRWLLWVLLLDNLLNYTAQVLIPLGINDGQTLRRWLPELRNQTFE